MLVEDHLTFNDKYKALGIDDLKDDGSSDDDEIDE
jgi:hypothetical protein